MQISPAVVAWRARVAFAMATAASWRAACGLAVPALWARQKEEEHWPAKASARVLCGRLP